MYIYIYIYTHNYMYVTSESACSGKTKKSAKVSPT